MEYPFKDLLPLDEVLAREGYYKDWTHLDPEVFYSLTQISEYIKTKGYGVDVRLLIAQLAEHFGLKTVQVVDLANLLQQKFENLEGVTQSFTNNINSLVAQMEADKDAVISNATVDSEVILARGGKPTLADRLNDSDAQLNETTEQLEQIHVNIKDFGAVGDGVTDDYQSIQDAIDYVYSNSVSGGSVYLPSGIYLLGESLNTFNGLGVDNMLNATTDNITTVSNGASSHIILKGHSKDTTILKTIATIPLIKPVGITEQAPLYRQTFENIRFIGNNLNTAFDFYNGMGLPREINIINCDFNNFDIGVKFNRSERQNLSGGIHVMLTLEKCSFGMNRIGIEINPDDTDIIKCRFERNREFGVHVTGGNRVAFESCKIQYNGTGTEGLTGGQIKLTGAITNLTFDNCYIENKSAQAVNNVGSTLFYVTTSSLSENKTYLYNLTVQNCYINGMHGSSIMNVDSNVTSMRGLTFTGGVVRNIRPSTLDNELFVIPNSVQLDTFHFSSFLEGITNTDGTPSTDYIMSNNDKIKTNNSYLYNPQITTPKLETFGGSLELVGGSVNPAGNQKYFGHTMFDVVKKATGIYEIIFKKDHVGTAGGNAAIYPIVANVFGAGSIRVDYDTSNKFTVRTLNKSDTLTDTAFSFFTLRSVR